MHDTARPPAAWFRAHRWPLALALALLQACHCGKGSTPTAGTVGAKGGKISSDACGLTLTFPEGALKSDTVFLITKGDTAPAVDGRVRASPVCTVTPPMLLEKAATVTQTFDPAKVPPRSSAQTADVRLSVVGSQQVRLPGVQVDVGAHKASAQTLGTGDFFVTVADTPPPASVTLNPPGPLALQPGQSTQFSATVTDANGQPANEKPVVWSTASSLVATVDQSGLLTAVQPGHTQLLATAGPAQGSAEIFVTSPTPSAGNFAWENPLPQGNHVRGLSLAFGRLVVAADNGTVLAQEGDGGFTQLLSSPGLGLAGAAVGGGRLGTAGTVDTVLQGIEHITGAAVALDPSGPSVATFDPSSLSPRAVYGDADGVIAVGAGNDAWLLGPGDGGWAPLETPVSEALLAVDADPTAGRRVLGARGQVYRLQGQDWFPIWDTPLGTLFSLAALLGHDGYGADAAHNLRRFEEGTGWQADTTPSGVALDSLSLLSRLGDSLALSGADTALQPHLWVRDPGADWRDVTGLDARDTLYAATGAGSSGYVGGSNGALYQYDGAHLTALRTGETEDITAVTVAPDGSAFAVTAGVCADSTCAFQPSHLLKRQGAAWVRVAGVEAPNALRAVAARSAGDVFIFGDGGRAWHYDGTGTTDLQMPPTSAAANLNAAHVCGADVWVAGSAGTLARFDGGQSFVLATGAPANTTFRALACTSATDIWAAGDFALWRFDGRAWNKVDTTPVNNQQWRALSVNAQEVWVGGETGYLLHSPDRTTWEAVQDPAGLTLYSASAFFEAAPGDLYLVGALQRPRQGFLLRWDGALWNPLDPGTDHPLYAIAGVATADGARELWLAGQGGALLHGR